MSNIGVTFDFAAESAKLRTEIDKVRKELSSINATTKGIKDGFATMGKAIVAGFSVGAVTAFLSKVNANVDALNDLADRLGASASGLQSLQVAASLAGGSAEGMNVALAKMSTTIGDAVAGNKAATEAFTRLGLSAKDLAALKPDEAFRKISDATAALPNSFERASVAQDVFGKGAKDIAGLLAEGGSAIDAVNEQLAKQGALLSDLDVKKIGVMNDELQFQETVVSNLGAKFLSGLSPAIGVATSVLGEMLGQVGGATDAGRGFGVVMVAAMKIAETGVYGLVAAFEAARSIISGVLYVIISGVQNVVQATAFMAEALDLGVAGSLRSASDTLDGIADSMNAVSVQATENAKKAGTNAITAATEIVKAGAIFDAAQANYEAKASAAAARNAAAQGMGSGYTAPESAGKTAKDKAGPSIYDAVKATSLVVSDPLTDPEYLMQQSLGAALLELRTQQSAEQLALVDQTNTGVLDSLLTSHQFQLQAEANKNATLGDMMGNLASMAIQQGGTLGKFGKAYAIAQTVWSTGQAVMKAMASVPYPANIAAAASVAAMGVAQLANIKKTNINGGGSIVSGRGGGASAGSSALSDNVAGTTKSTESDQKSAIQIFLSGPLVETAGTARWLQEVMQEATTRDMVFFSSNSRQAAEIRGG